MPSPPEPPRPPLPRLYAILDVEATRTRGLDALDLTTAWLDAGVRLLQIRAKTLTFGPFTTLARSVTARTHPAGCTVIINDRADVAALSGADGVHVGQSDLRPREIRDRVGRWGRGDAMPHAPELIGLSTHTPAQAAAAVSEPIEYLAIGPVFPTASKADSSPTVGLAGVRAAVQASGGLPVVAIGGITLATAAAVIDAGAVSVAVISDLLVGAADARARAYLRVLA